MDILLQSSDLYSKYLKMTILSICDSNKNHELKFHILSDGISDLSKKEINDIAESRNADIYLYEMEGLKNRLKGIVPLFHGSYSTYYKLFVSEILPPEIRRVLYLDVDLLCFGELSELFEMSMDGYYIMGVSSLLNVKMNCNYVNGGVQLINLEAYRTYDVLNVFINYLKSGKDLNYADQSVVHNTISDHIGLLPLKYNVVTPFIFLSYKRLLSIYNLDSFYSYKEYIDAVKNPTVVHCTAWCVERPWQKYTLHPCKTYYRAYQKAIGVFPEANSIFKLFVSAIKLVCYKFCPLIILRRMIHRKSGVVD